MRWTASQILADSQEAKEEFRGRRIREPQDTYLEAFAALERANVTLIGRLPRLLENPIDPSFISELLRDEHLRTALRYLGAPPISEDDLKTLVGASLAWTRVRDNPGLASDIRDVIVQILDPKRFPWVYTSRPPTANEKEAAILASTVVATAQRVQTSRRIDEKAALEGSVRQVLLNLGLTPVPIRRVENIRREAPLPGEFTAGSCVVGEDEADVVVGLYDHRILAIECKASNSEINSRKRINKEVAQDAQNWVSRFGADMLVPAAAIQGVFKPSYIEAAQQIPIVFFWAHRLTDLHNFILRTRQS